MNEIIKNELDEHINIASSLYKLTDSIALSAEICVDCLRNGGKILLFGNGGSAADAQHIAAELVGRYKIERESLPAIALTTDTSALTSIGNDYGYNHIFDRQVRALAKNGDVLIGISTSGNSKNVLNAINIAPELNCKSIGFTGDNGGKMRDVCDILLKVPSNDTARIQEMHILIGHTFCQLIDHEFKT